MELINVSAFYWAKIMIKLCVSIRYFGVVILRALDGTGEFFDRGTLIGITIFPLSSHEGLRVGKHTEIYVFPI